MNVSDPMIPPPPTTPFDQIKARQRATWASGDYAVIGTTLQIVGERLCEALDLRAGQRVLDVAAGNGNVSLAAARRWCDVLATDYVPELLRAASIRAEAERLPLRCEVADAEALPYDDGAFDVVVSSFGVMFTPDQERAARELVRVCRPGGKIGLANWTPDGFIGQLFAVVGRHVPPAPGLRSPSAWGTLARLAELFGADAEVVAEPREFVFRYRSPEHWLEVFRTLYGPVQKAFAALAPAAQPALAADLLDLVARFQRAHDGTMVVPGRYLEIVVTRR